MHFTGLRIRARAYALTVVVHLVLGACDDDPPANEPDAVEMRSDAAAMRSDSAVTDAGAEDARADASAGTTTTISITHEGLQRDYVLYVPGVVDCSEPVPVVLNYHPYTSNAADQQALTSYNDLADREGFIVVYPEGIDGSFNGGSCCGKNSKLPLGTSEADDGAFTRAIIADLAERTCIDPSRVYSTGMSNGGAMSEYNACVNADLFAGVAPVSGIGFGQPVCDPSRPISMITFNGTDDALNSYAGAQQAVQDWLSRNGCGGDPVRESFGASHCDTWNECSDGVVVTSCSIEGMQHCWPGSPATWSDCMTGGLEDIDATEMGWHFMRQYRLPDGVAPADADGGA